MMIDTQEGGTTMRFFRRRRRLRLRRAFGIAFSTMMVTAALPALAQACTVTTTGGTQVFGRFGDFANYALAPTGSFESGTSGWTLSGASVQSGNESYYVNSTTDSHSLVINATGSAISPPICVDITMPTFRFFARQVSGSWAQMNVNVLWTDSSGVQHSTAVGSWQGGTSWGPTAALSLGSALPLWQSGSTIPVRLQFLPAAYGGSLAIDDLYIDPYSK